MYWKQVDKPKSTEIAKMVYEDEKMFKTIDIFAAFKELYGCIKTKAYKEQYQRCKRKDKLIEINKKLKNPE